MRRSSSTRDVTPRPKSTVMTGESACSSNGRSLAWRGSAPASLASSARPRSACRSRSSPPWPTSPASQPSSRHVPQSSTDVRLDGASLQPARCQGTRAPRASTAAVMAASDTARARACHPPRRTANLPTTEFPDELLGARRALHDRLRRSLPSRGGTRRPSPKRRGFWGSPPHAGSALPSDSDSVGRLPDTLLEHRTGCSRRLLADFRRIALASLLKLATAVIVVSPRAAWNSAKILGPQPVRCSRRRRGSGFGGEPKRTESTQWTQSA